MIQHAARVVTHSGTVRKRVIMAVGIPAGACALFMLLFLFRLREPAFEGKGLSLWLEDLDSDKPEEVSLRAQNAVRQMGTDALPSLVAMLRKKDSSFKSRLIELSSVQSIVKFDPVPAQTQRLRAAFAIGAVLGPGAEAAIPAVAALLSDPETTQEAARALVGIGSEAIPALTNALARQRVEVRRAIALELGGLLAEGTGAVPALVGRLEDEDSLVRNYAAMSLGQLPCDASQVVPALIRNLDDPVAHVRGQAALTLGGFRDHAKVAMPLLLKKTRDPDIRVRDAAGKALRQIDPDALPRTANP